MQWVIKEAGEEIFIDSNEIDYEAVWDALGLKGNQRAGANRIIDLYHSSESNKVIFIVNEYSSMKPSNREEQRHVADHYQVRVELERVARDELSKRDIEDSPLLEKLTSFYNILEIHSKWRGFENHPQAPFRLNCITLRELEDSNPDLGEYV